MTRFDEIYERLKSIAKRELARQQRNTLCTTALVHEAFIKLAEHASRAALRASTPPTANQSVAERAHVINLVAKVMRQITVDHARAKQTQKRMALAQDIDAIMDDTLRLVTPAQDFDLVAFDQALSQLEQQHPRMARCMELSYFAGVENQEIAQLAGVDLRTVQRDLLAARVILQAQLQG
jgi:RNA polymerase sigma factor (TIGR02999 family)